MQKGFDTEFRNNSQILLRGLFFETNKNSLRQAKYTLKDSDHTVDGITYPSLFKYYMDMGDQTEYTFATTYLEGWNHWEKLCRCEWFVPYISRWRKELHLRTVSEALLVIKNEAKDKQSKNQFQANKILIDRSWEAAIPQSKQASKRGRPSKDDITAEIKQAAEEESLILKDLELLEDN